MHVHTVRAAGVANVTCMGQDDPYWPFSVTTDPRKAMTAQPLGLAGHAVSHLGWHWLAPSVALPAAASAPRQRPREPKDPDYLAESGRGLHVIEALSDRWGFTVPAESGKVVWALFSVRLNRQPPDWGWFAARPSSPARSAQARSIV